MEQSDPFTGTWRFVAGRSTLSTPPPPSWTWTIHASPDDIEIREHMVRADAPDVHVSLRAKFDGAEYPVEGSFAVATMSYSRVGRNIVVGTGRKDGVVSLTETMTVYTESATLTLQYAFYKDAEVAASGVAVFETT